MLDETTILAVDDDKIPLEKTRLEQLLELTDQGIYSIDMDGNCTFINQPGLRILGYHVEELIGNKINSLIRCDTLLQSEKKCLSEKSITQTDASYRDHDAVFCKKDGGSFPASYSIHPLIEHDMTVGAVITFSDITAIKKVHEELYAAKDLAETASKTKSSFLATMSHEIRTPMNGVLGMNSLLLETVLTAEQREFAEIVRKSGENLLTIINEILDFSKIESGKLDLEILDFDLRVTLEDTAELLALRSEDAGLELICSIDSVIPPYLRGDPGRIRQIVTNLVGNAIKFTRKGEVDICAKLKSEQDDYVTILFEIMDTGIGIPESRLAAIFEPFTQADGSTTRKFGGTGLGLAICKQLVEMMGGEIGVTSEEGVGSTFWFTLCLEKQPAQNREVYKALQMIGQGKLTDERILVVDDNATNRILMKNLLRTWGCRYEVANDGVEGLKMLLEAAQSGDPFRIAVLDQQMPNMDGTELGRQIKENPLIASTIMVMLTSMGQRGDATLLEKIGFAGYMNKPVRQTQLYDCLTLVLGSDIEAKNDEGAQPSCGIITRHIITESVRPGVRILLVEDNVINQKVAQHMLSTFGYKADVAADGQEAIRALEMINYHIVLMDCMMPVMNGFEATSVIRDTTSAVLNHNVPIIAMTANATLEDRGKCLESGMNDYMSKPIKKVILAELIDKWLEYDAIERNSNQDSTDLLNDPTLFDLSGMLASTANDPRYMGFVLDETIALLPDKLKKLRLLIESEDIQAVRMQAKVMQGHADEIFAPSLGAICLKIETAAKDNDVKTAHELLPDLERSIKKTIEAIKNATY